MIDMATAADPTVAMLGFEAGGEHWLVAAGEAGEVLPVPKIAHVPMTTAWFRGVVNIRGTLYSVSDLAAFEGKAVTPVTSAARLLLIGNGARRNAGDNIALLMAATLGFKRLSALETLPDAAVRQPWHGARYRDESGRSWTTLRLARLIEMSAFLDVAA